MSNPFIKIYHFFVSRRVLMWSTLCALVVAMTFGAMSVRFEEDITSFFPEEEQSVSQILSNMELSNRFMVFVSSVGDQSDEYDLSYSVDTLVSMLESRMDFTRNAVLTSRVDDLMLEKVTDFIYSNLPLLLTQDDFNRLDSLCFDEVIENSMTDNYARLTSAMGGYISDYIYRDPLNIGTPKLKGLEAMGSGYEYDIVDGYVFSPDYKTVMFYIDPLENCDKSLLVETIEQTLELYNGCHSEFRADYFGAPAVAYYNARQIKYDSTVTLNIAIVIVAIFIFLAFRRRRNIVLIIVPVLFGIVFALSLVFLIQGGISLIAVGSGSIIFGLAFSYAIHFISHADHCKDVPTIISELAYPLTVGSITTIGAFVGLLFTNSKLLQDFGLFSSLSLVGTTLFTLIFLPQFVYVNSTKSSSTKLLNAIDKVAGRSYEKNKILVWLIVCFVLLSAFVFNQVRFDSNMMNLNYMPEHLARAEKMLEGFSGKKQGESNVMMLAVAANSDDAIVTYEALIGSLDSLCRGGKVVSYSDVSEYIVCDSLQEVRLARWNEYWSVEQRERVIETISESAQRLGFQQGAFNRFTELINREYSNIEYSKGSEIAELFPEWITSSDMLSIITVQMRILDTVKGEVYSYFANNHSGVIAADMSYFAGQMARDVSDNFYLVLYISGLLIFSVLLLSYGRIELAVISFMPMFLGWLIIIGLMSLFGVEFNIVTIILSTFIFGIGDDFSIFVMDGLQGNYRDNGGLLSHHKRAIFISAFSLIVGMGALIFAKHPAMYSLGLISLIGMSVVVLVSYTVPPLLFRKMATDHTRKGNFPYTLLGILNTVYAFGLFLLGCLIIQLSMVLSFLVIYKKSTRQLFINRLTSWSTRSFLKVMVTTKWVRINRHNEDFSKPAVIIANHQSFIDILMLMGLGSKKIMVTNSWVWRNPFFGAIVRFLGFYHIVDGYENSVDALREKVEKGYSIIVFAEGKRTVDMKIARFHKGAFFLAEKLELDILPIMIYGSGLVSSRSQPMYIKHGVLVSEILPRISPADESFGVGYRERSKSIGRYFKAEYDRLYEEFNRALNPYFRDAIIKNYIYKGPVLEWYMKIKLRIEKWYDHYDRLLPRSGYIVDLGCGYGAMSYMLSMLSSNRRITAIDYDADKISVAQNSFLKNSRIEFFSADIRSFDIPQADGYIISDVLHYIDQESQRNVIKKCIDGLSEKGVLIIRDGDSSQQQTHSNTEATERWSTQYMKFNKTDGPLCFLSSEMIFDIAGQCGMNVEIVQTGRKTSNTLFLITHKR